MDLSAFAQTALSVDSQPNLMTTQEAVRQGMCVIDGGATQTIGSIAAVEAVLEQNRKLHGATRLKGLCATEPPIFSFGNSTENRCCSTAKLEVSANGQPGELQVHTLDQGQSPILLSVETLRRLGLSSILGMIWLCLGPWMIGRCFDSSAVSPAINFYL